MEDPRKRNKKSPGILPIFGPKPDRASIAQAARNLSQALKRKQ